MPPMQMPSITQLNKIITEPEMEKSNVLFFKL